MTASPRTVRPSNATAMRLSGAPARRAPNGFDHGATNPQLAGCKGTTVTPAAATAATQPPSEPSRGQLAPPSASTAASGRSMTMAPSGRTKASAPSCQPIKRCRMAKSTPAPCSRRSQARSSGDAFIALGNTRPLVPTKVSCPSASHQARTRSGGNASMAARKCWFGGL
jgi:hypothetical protein